MTTAMVMTMVGFRIRILGDIVAPMPAEWFEKSDNSDKDLF